MIDDEKIKRLGVKVVRGQQECGADGLTMIDKLKALSPSLINGDNQLDVRALCDLIDAKHTTSNDQGLELTFAGKGIARHLASTPTQFELKTELGPSKNFDSTANVFIRGDNIDVIKILYKNYHKKIKVVYIDPPYNTKNDNFVYKDNFKLSDQDLIDDFSLNETTKDFLHNVYGTRSHSGWLAFMYPRLKLARDLLRDDGLLIISIDDNEQANLKIICDEIYGEDNFIACLPTIMNLKGNNDEFGFAGTHEYTLVYAKDAACATIGEFDISEDEQDLWHEDETGPWKRGRALKAAGENASRAARPQLFYPIYIDEQSLSVSIVRDEAHTYELLPVTGDKELRWYWSAEKVGKDSSEIIVVKNKNNGYALYKKQRPELGDIPSKKPKSLFYKPAYSSGNGTNLIKSLLGGRVFSNPKPLQLVSDLIALATADVDDALVLDFFAGSGTTGDAVVRLNAFDGGHRKYILVQADEEIDASDQAVAFKFCRDNKIEPVISSITLARLDRAGAEAERLAREIDDIATVSGASSLSLAPAADHASSGRNPRRADTTADSAKMETGGAGTDADSLDIGYRVFSLVKKPAVSQKSQPQTSPGSQAQGGLGLAIDSRRTCALDTLINMMCATGHSLDTPIECLTENVLYRAGADLFVLDSIASAQLEAFPDAQIYLDGWADINLEDYLNLGTGSRENISVVL